MKSRKKSFHPLVAPIVVALITGLIALIAGFLVVRGMEPKVEVVETVREVTHTDPALIEKIESLEKQIESLK